MSFRERRTAEKRKRLGYFYIKDPWFESGHQIPKSSSKVEWIGALNFCLHAVGSFIHLRHVWAGLQKFIHLCHPAALAGYEHASKI